jgi:phenylacetate-CoA ligase
MGKLPARRLELIEFKVSDFFYPIDLAQTYLLLRQSEHWSQAQVETYQRAKLAALLRHCIVNVPYYRGHFQRAGMDAGAIRAENALACLESLPILDKDILRETPDLFTARNAGRFNAKALQTSGTTGTPLTIYWDRGSNVMEFCCIQRLWRWAGFRIGQPFLDLRSRLLSDDEPRLIRDGDARYLRNWKVNGLEFNADSINESNVEAYYGVLLRYRPCLVRGHPQAIQYLAALLRSKALTGWRPTAVTTASEALYDFQRREIEEAWGVAVLDSYGLREHNVFIAQCPEGSYHVSPEYGICEILDDDWKPVKPGREGWIIATGLHNYAQPLLRYNTRDRAIAAGGGRTCTCGRTLPVIERIVGRIDDCLRTRDGRRYSGMSFAFFGRRGIRKARLVQESFETVTVQLVVTPDFDERESALLLEALERKVDHKIKFRPRIVDDIVQETSGKFKFVVSRLDRTDV